MQTATRSKAALVQDIELVNAQIQTLVHREADFQRILDDLRKMKDEAVAERLELEARRNELETQKEPINWLPTELLIQIFTAFTDLDFEDINYRPPVVVLHVSKKWRAIALSTPQLWSRIILEGFRNPEVAQTFLLQSGRSLLEVDYSSLQEHKANQECSHMVDFLANVSQHFSRVGALALCFKIPLPIVYLLPFINDFANAFPRLAQLTLSISTPNPSFIEAPSLIDKEDAILMSRRPAPSNSALLYLKLEQVPLFNFPVAFISNLRTLDLYCSPRKMNSARHDYHLKMSSLCCFLSLTPLLEELILVNTVPYFDVTPPPIDSADAVDGSLVQMYPVRLEHLKAIDWTYPYTADVHRFLTMIDAPGMEKLDIWVEELPAKRILETLNMRGYHPATSSHKYTRGVISFPGLRDLSLQTAGEDMAACVLRKFSLPSLEKVAFTNVDSAAREAAGAVDALPIFPRLESIFRDPRLPNLTHLTLSHFRISDELGRAEGVLGYMPLLTSLSLDSCAGVGRLLDGLKERVAVGVQRGVKLCPRLEALSFWGCQDVDFDGLRAVVLARNRSAVILEEGSKGLDGATGTITREAVVVVQQGGKQAADAPQRGRKIKPLRKLRRHAHGFVPSSPHFVSTVIAMREALAPAHITYVRVANCRLINQDDASSLRDLGVVDVVWAGSD
ncbi:unnamed protein product [Cyclocybe aegerita]|uniref:F-box domain-containing protein n=1 Tax=Cyclocybe aegerita TaxID=1973307 RepID=A0A8S0WB42_CYCAE|nr:unnamed protein product [Cyclocybe aegerita]